MLVKNAMEEKGETGVLGFEPRNGGTKTRCLTTWLHPITQALLD
jgi:hypothetical protein